MNYEEVGLASMTGYGRAVQRLEGWRLQVECRSVNHKRLSTRVDTPDGLQWLEPRIESRLCDVLQRGRVDVRVQLEPAGDEQAAFQRIDEHRFCAVADELRRLADEHGLRQPVSFEAACEFSDFFESDTTEVFSPRDADALMAVFDDALDDLVASRRKEGVGIARQLDDYLQQLEKFLDDARQLKEDKDETEWCRVETRLREALRDFEIEEIGEDRLAQEVAYYVEKGDIAEEMQRARSHVDQLGDVVDGADGAVGKKIDFYLQELIRETNTMGSKSRHPALTDCVIEMKSLIEKMREQAANIE